MKIAITIPTGEKLSNGGSFTKKPRKAAQSNDGSQYLAEGGELEGPSHEQGGVPVVEEGTGEPMAEAEGGERIFSIEDTQMMEEAAAQIMELSQQDPNAADDAAKQLGYAVVEMLMRQEQNQQQQMGAGGAPAQTGGAPMDDMMAQAANQFV
jgi:hypothetical protein